MIEVHEASAAIKTQGYVIVPDVLSPDFVQALAESLDALRREDVERFGKEYLYRIGQEGFVVNVGDRGAPFERLLLERPVRGIVEELLGPGAFLYLFQGVIVPPGGGVGAYPWKWHCDLYHVVLEVGDRAFLPGLNCLFYLDDVDERNGGTWIVPGTQGLTDEEVPCGDEDFMRHAAFQVKARAGSVVVFNPLLWHCAGANTTAAARRAVKMLMVREWMLPQMDYSRSVRPSVLSRLDDEALCILGHHSRVPRTFEEMQRASGRAAGRRAVDSAAAPRGRARDDGRRERGR
jgi:ectoine hydroxylase-related dioxygenase (phytanoyl-CoA dioxygenase family)